MLGFGAWLSSELLLLPFTGAFGLWDASVKLGNASPAVPGGCRARLALISAEQSHVPLALARGSDALRELGTVLLAELRLCFSLGSFVGELPPSPCSWQPRKEMAGEAFLDRTSGAGSAGV